MKVKQVFFFSRCFHIVIRLISLLSVLEAELKAFRLSGVVKRVDYSARKQFTEYLCLLSSQLELVTNHSERKLLTYEVAFNLLSVFSNTDSSSPFDI